MGGDCSYALSRAPEHRRADSCTKQLAGNIKYLFNHADDYDEGGDHGDDGDDNDDDDNAAVVPLSTYWAWSEGSRELRV